MIPSDRRMEIIQGLAVVLMFAMVMGATIWMAHQLKEERAKTPELSMPDTPANRRLDEWVAAFRTAAADRCAELHAMKAYEPLTKQDVDRAVRWVRENHDWDLEEPEPCASVAPT